MTLKQIEAFYWVATLGTFALAAGRLHVTQSSLSKRIAELEDGLGELLFERAGRRATLTAAGQTMLPKARRMLELADDMRSGARPDAALEGVCHLGVSELSATTWLPSFVGRLRDDYPDLTLMPQVGLGRSLERQVERGDLDLAVIAGGASSPAMASEPLGDVAFAWMAAPTRVGRRGLPATGRLTGHPVISSTPDSNVELLLGNWAAAANIDVARTIGCNSLTATVGLTVAGVGLSCLPRDYVATLVRRRLLVTLRRRPSPTLTYNVLWRRSDSRPLVDEMRRRIAAQADFRAPNRLWA